MSKRILWVIISFLLVTIGILVIFMSRPEKKLSSVGLSEKSSSLKTMRVESTKCPQEIEIDLNVEPLKTKSISFPISGKLEKGDIDLKVGQKFKFNDLLAKLNIRPAFENLNELKVDLKSSLKSAIEDFEKELPALKSKWENFSNSISVSTRLKDLPSSQSNMETRILIDNGVVNAYMEAKKQEEDIEKYFFLAKSSGTITKVNYKPGTFVKKGQTIAEFTTKRSNTLVGNIENIIKEAPEDVVIKNASGENIGTGRFVKRVKQSDTQDLLYYNYEGQLKENSRYYFTLRTEIDCIRIPDKALKGSSVKVMQGEKIIDREIDLLFKKDEYAFVSGLKEGEEIVLHE